MANDAYALPGQPRWLELDTFNLTLPFGWEDEAAGLRGHLFASFDNATLVLSIKGTSIDGPLPPKGRSTARLDQVNDNLFFSCCCGTLPSDLCSCKAPFGGPLGRKRKTCDEGCLTEGLFGPESYYPEAVALLAQVRVHYPTADIWLVGHSLGGVVAGLLGLTFGLPAVTFEAPPDALVVGRLGLRVPRVEANPVTHVFHTGDMIATGACRGPLSACGRGGYSMESSCKQGNLRVYDTVAKWGWSVDRTGRSHTIQWVIGASFRCSAVSKAPSTLLRHRHGHDADSRPLPADNVYSKPWNNGEIEGPEGRGRDWTYVWFCLSSG
jgi:lipase ATG15